MPSLTPWRPSRREQALQWWLSQILRFGIGGGGLVWETIIDKLKTPTALVVFGGIASAEDVVGYVRSARERVTREREARGRELEEPRSSAAEHKPPPKGRAGHG